MSRPRTRTRALLVSAVTALGSVVVLAPPAAATHVPEYCTDLEALGLSNVEATICIAGDLGFYEPLWVTCNTVTGCSARVTAGHHGAADVHGHVCAGVENLQPLCVTLGTGDVPVFPIPPQSVCVTPRGGPPCEEPQ